MLRRLRQLKKTENNVLSRIVALVPATLTELSLSWQGHSNYTQALPNFARVFWEGRNVLPEHVNGLRRLTLEGFELDRAYFLPFLERQRGTLAYLELENIDFKPEKPYGSKLGVSGGIGSEDWHSDEDLARFFCWIARELHLHRASLSGRFRERDRDYDMDRWIEKRFEKTGERRSNRAGYQLSRAIATATRHHCTSRKRGCQATRDEYIRYVIGRLYRIILAREGIDRLRGGGF